MRKLLVVLFAITLVAGCVSNRTFKAEKQRIGRIEFQQMKDIENLDQLREDYELTSSPSRRCLPTSMMNWSISRKTSLR